MFPPDCIWAYRITRNPEFYTRLLFIFYPYSMKLSCILQSAIEFFKIALLNSRYIIASQYFNNQNPIAIQKLGKTNNPSSPEYRRTKILENVTHQPPSRIKLFIRILILWVTHQF